MKPKRRTPLKIRLAEAEYSREELTRLVQLAKKPGGKKFNSAVDFLKCIQKL